MRRNLRIEELGDLLGSPTLAVLATRRKDGTTLLSPVWHEWRDGGFSIITWADDIKSRQLGRDPRCTVLVAENAPPFRGVELQGTAQLSRPADIMDILRRIAIRYLGEEQGEAYTLASAGEQLELMRIVEARLRAWDFRDDFGE